MRPLHEIRTPEGTYMNGGWRRFQLPRVYVQETNGEGWWRRRRPRRGITTARWPLVIKGGQLGLQTRSQARGSVGPSFRGRGMIVFTCHLPGRADDTPGHPTGGRWPWPLTCDGGQGSIERWQADCSPVALDANGGSEADAMRRAVLTAP
jgi:hypothetical protein